MDLVSILQGNNGDKITPALSSTDKGQTPELDSTDQVSLRAIDSESNSIKYNDANQGVINSTSDSNVAPITNNDGKYTDPQEDAVYKSTSKLNQVKKDTKQLLKDETSNLSDLLDYAETMGVHGLISSTRELAGDVVNRTAGLFGFRTKNNRNELANGVKALLIGEGENSEGSKELWRDDLVIEGKDGDKVIPRLPQGPNELGSAKDLANTISDEQQRTQNQVQLTADNSLKGDLQKYKQNLVGTATGIGRSIGNYVVNRAQSVASKLLGSSLNLGKKIKSTSWNTRVINNSDNNLSQANYTYFRDGSFIPTKSGSDHFPGYSALQNFDARVDRFYDFKIEAPKHLVALGLPPAESIAVAKGKSQWSSNPAELGTSTTNDNLPVFNEETGNNLRNVLPLDFQANINSVDTVRLQNGETFDLGYFGSVALTRRLDMIASITTTFIEDNNYSVRTWLEKYRDYMYGDIPNRVNENRNPYIHKPIYQGYYYITFYSLDPSRRKVLYSRTFWGVPNFDLNITPNPSDVKMFQVNWDIIGESEIVAIDKLVNKSEAKSRSNQQVNQQPQQS